MIFELLPDVVAVTLVSRDSVGGFGEHLVDVALPYPCQHGGDARSLLLGDPAAPLIA